MDFVGWKTWATHRVPRRRTLGNLERRLREAGHALVRRDPVRGIATVDLRATVVREPGRARREMPATGALHSTLASYAGHLCQGGSLRAWQSVLARHPWLEAVVAVDTWDVALRWPPRAGCAASLWRQVHGLVGAAPPRMLVFCPVGAFIEFRGDHAAEAAAVLGLRRVHLPRGPWAFGAGFPRRWSRAFTDRALARGWSVAIAHEGPWRGRRARRSREVQQVLLPA